MSMCLQFRGTVIAFSLYGLLAGVGCTRTIALQLVDDRTGAGISNASVVRSGIRNQFPWVLSERETSDTDGEGVIRVPLNNRSYQSVSFSKPGFRPCVVRIGSDKDGKRIVTDDRAPRVWLEPVAGVIRIPMDVEQGVVPDSHP
jgi:hypothetical protein